jgi:hypothetical protein
VHDAHRNVLDVFLGRGFDLLVGHKSPLPTGCRGGNGSSTSMSASGSRKGFLCEHGAIREDDRHSAQLASNAQVTSEPGRGVR